MREPGCDVHLGFIAAGVVWVYPKPNADLCKGQTADHIKLKLGSEPRWDRKVARSASHRHWEQKSRGRSGGQVARRTDAEDQTQQIQRRRSPRSEPPAMEPTVSLVSLQ